MKRNLILFIVLLNTIVYGQGNKPYFQQEVKYKIKVTLNDKDNTLSAFENIVYKNNSPDTLKELWFHLWPNAYRNQNTALAKQKLENGSSALYFAEEKERGYIDSIDFRSNGISLPWRFDSKNIDICSIQLNTALFPGDSIEITTPFFVKIPDAKFSRLGHTGQFYAITQWYPKPAVYDNKGWHPIPFLDQGEFYSEFGSFEVSITLPENYVIGATGELVNGEKEIAWLTEKAGQTIIYSDKKDMAFPPSSDILKTLTYRQDNIHDFAFFADKRYHVRKGEVTLPESGRKVTTWAFYTNNESELWLKAIDYINQGVRDYSIWVGEYAYASCTAIDGTIAAGGGMEYPMITIIGRCGNAPTLETTIVHEVGHNWFYGILGSNEREHPWMDEGVNTYYETRSFIKAHPEQSRGNFNELSDGGNLARFLNSDRINQRQFARLTYLVAASFNSDQPIELPATDYTNINYGIIVYEKTNAAFSYLENYLGTELYDRCMHAYYHEWKFRHPYPEDMQRIFEITSGKNLNWFFKDLLNASKKQDIKINCIKNTGSTSELKINSKNTTWPFPVSSIKNDSTITTTWIEPTKNKDSYQLPCNNCDGFAIDKKEVTFDVNNLNNNIRSGGIFKKSSPIELKLLGGLPYKPARQIFFSPVAGWNNYNKLMAGLLVHNSFLPQRKFEYILMPMYGFSDKELAGMAQLDYHFLPVSNLFRDITLSTGMRRFAYDYRSYKDISGELVPDHFHYLRIRPALRFDFRQQDPRSHQYQYLELSSIHLLTDDVSYSYMTNGVPFGEVKQENVSLYRLQYGYTNTRVLDPWSVRARYEGADGLAKTDLTLKYKFCYNNTKRGIDFRVFTGVVWNNQLDASYNYNLSDRSTASGNTDYAYDDLYFGRSETEGFLSKQMALRDGAFKSINQLGSAREQLLSFNVEADFPGKLPFRFFLDVATYKGLKDDVKSTYDLDQSFTYDAGICLTIAKEAVAIYLPLFRAKDIKEYESTNELKLADQIRFVFDISKMNPLDLRKKIYQ